MRVRTYPGRLNRGEWLRISSRRRLLLIKRAESDLLELWRTCSKKPCRRAHSCLGDERCPSRPWLADLNHPNRGQPDFVFSFRYPDRLVFPKQVLKYLQFGLEPLPAEDIVQESAAQDGADAAAALRLVLRLQRRRRRPAVRGRDEPDQ
jgi:hypothetical protein